MIDPTNDQRREMIEVLNKTHALINSMQIAGLEEKVIVPAIHTALVERYLRAGGVSNSIVVARKLKPVIVPLAVCCFDLNPI